MHFVREKINTENAPKLPTHREDTEQQISTLFYGFVWDFLWVGGPPAPDPDV